MCREKATSAILMKMLLGSPLRVQGKAKLQETSVDRSRITPACAGKSNYNAPTQTDMKDHPCVCREKHGQ